MGDESGAQGGQQEIEPDHRTGRAGKACLQPQWMDLISQMLRKQINLCLVLPGERARKDQTARGRAPRRKAASPSVCAMPGSHLLPGAELRHTHIPEEEGTSGPRPHRSACGKFSPSPGAWLFRL